MKKPVVVEHIDAQISREVLAQTIVDISTSMKRLLSSGLNRKAIIILIHDQSRIGKREIELVLNNLEALAEDYT